MQQVKDQLPGRAMEASNELRNAVQEVLSGQRGGRRYGSHVASAPGEPPAVWHGKLNGNWRPVESGPNGEYPAIEVNLEYADYMEHGTPGGKIAPRPFVDKTVDKAKPAILAIYNRPFNLSP